jgi:hypothetical protein
MPQPLSTQAKAVERSKSGGSSGAIGTVFFVIICVAGGVAGKNCARSVAPNRSNGSSYSPAPAPPSANSLSFQNVAGRSGPLALSGASRRKQTPSSQLNTHGTRVTIVPSLPDANGHVTTVLSITEGPIAKLFGRLVAVKAL